MAPRNRQADDGETDSKCLDARRSSANVGADRSVEGLLARLLYGTGMRLMEGLSLRVKDLDFDRHVLIVPLSAPACTFRTHWSASTLVPGSLGHGIGCFPHPPWR